MVCCLAPTNICTVQPLHLRFQKNKISIVAQCLLNMTGKTHPWYLDNTVTPTREERKTSSRYASLDAKKSHKVPLLDEKLQAVSNCWPKGNESFLRIWPLIGYLIPKNQLWKHAETSNSKWTQEDVFIQLVLYMYQLKKKKAWMWKWPGNECY